VPGHVGTSQSFLVKALFNLVHKQQLEVKFPQETKALSEMSLTAQL